MFTPVTHLFSAMSMKNIFNLASFFCTSSSSSLLCGWWSSVAESLPRKRRLELELLITRNMPAIALRAGMAPILFWHPSAWASTRSHRHTFNANLSLVKRTGHAKI
mmetsp:Transcript_8794/g.19448  ORF Transcript_8794/g.19448 Transcript_8794/m.19448 type:complete len:106 (+) Transcript_8794:2370-2687(+)